MSCRCSKIEPEKQSSQAAATAGPGAGGENSRQSASFNEGGDQSWPIRYFTSLAALAALWFLGYWHARPLAQGLVFGLFGLEAGSEMGTALEFFIYDTIKILLLLLGLIYALAWLRASLNVDWVRDYLAGKGRALGYVLAAVFGSVTPFCSCSSVPLFLGFTTAGLPLGFTMAFLITSPLVNELAVVLLWSLMGWKFTLIYVAVSLASGVMGGFFFDRIKAERWLQPFVLKLRQQVHQPLGTVKKTDKPQKLSLRQRHLFALAETSGIFKRVWKWVVIGVGLGAALHGFVPENWFAENLGSGRWWTVPAAVLLGIPLYSNVTAVVPIMESLLLKGLPLGSTLAFCLSSVAASIPELIMLRQIMSIKLLAVFLVYLWLTFTLVGWLFNYLQPYIL